MARPARRYGPHTTCYNRFVRWRRAGIWDQIMDALAAAHDAAVQMIDTSIVRVHQHGACIANNSGQHIGRSRGGVDQQCRCGRQRFAGAARPYWWSGARQPALLELAAIPTSRGCWQIAATTRTRSGHLSPNGARGRTSRPDAIERIRSVHPYLYRERNLVERFFNKIKQCRRVATRYDKLAANYLAFVKLACIRLWLRVYKSTP